MNKFYGTNICVSHSIYKETSSMFEYRYLDKIRVKGRSKILNIYELVSEK